MDNSRDGRHRPKINLRCDNCTVQKKGCFIYAGESTCTKCVERGKACQLNGVAVGLQQYRNFEGPGPREREQLELKNLTPFHPKITENYGLLQSQSTSNKKSSNSRTTRSNTKAEAQPTPLAQPNFHATSGKSVLTPGSKQRGALEQPTMTSNKQRTDQRVEVDVQDEVGDEEERLIKIAKYTHPSHLVRFGCYIDETTGKATLECWNPGFESRLTDAVSTCSNSHLIHSTSHSKIPSSLVFNPYAPSNPSPLANETLSAAPNVECAHPEYNFNRPVLCCQHIDVDPTELPKQKTHSLMMVKWGRQNSGLEAKEFAGWEDSTVWSKYKYIIIINKLAPKMDPTVAREITYLGCKSLAKHDFAEITLDNPDSYPEIVTMSTFKQLYCGEDAKFKDKACLVQKFVPAHMYCDVHDQSFTVGEAVYRPAYTSLDHSAALSAPKELLFDVNEYEFQLSGKKGRYRPSKHIPDLNNPHHHAEHFATSRGLTYDPQTNSFTIPDSAYNLVRQYPSMYSKPEAFFNDRTALYLGYNESFDHNAKAIYGRDTYKLGDEYKLEKSIDWTKFPGPQKGQKGGGAVSERKENAGVLPNFMIGNLGDEILEPDDFFGDAWW